MHTTEVGVGQIGGEEHEYELIGLEEGSICVIAVVCCAEVLKLV